MNNTHDQLKWIVHPHSYARKGSRAISVIHESYVHGLESYGWHNSDKIFIMSDTQYGEISEDLYLVLIDFAKTKAAKMNGDGVEPDYERVESDKARKIATDAYYAKLFAPITKELRDDLAKSLIEGINNE